MDPILIGKKGSWPRGGCGQDPGFGSLGGKITEVAALTL